MAWLAVMRIATVVAAPIAVVIAVKASAPGRRDHGRWLGG
jgi:hypothetical protein